MKKSKEDLNRIHKEKCRELKRIRGRIAEDLGIELRQRECTYEGYCSGTCPACRREEMQLNAALLKRLRQGANLKGRAATAGLAAAAALCLTGCTPPEQNETEGMASPAYALPEDGSLPADWQVNGEYLPEDDMGEDGQSAGQADEGAWSIEQLEGEIPAGFPEDPGQSEYGTPGEDMELEGDVAYLPETSETAEAPSIPDSSETAETPSMPDSSETAETPSMPGTEESTQNE